MAGKAGVVGMGRVGPVVVDAEPSNPGGGVDGIGASGWMGAGGPVVAMGMTDGEFINEALAMCGVYRRRDFLLRSVTRPAPSTRTTYWSNCRTSTTIPVRSHLVGCGPTRFCSLT